MSDRNDPIARVQEVLDDIVTEGLYATGVQCSIWHETLGRSDLVAGTRLPGDPMTSEVLFSTWCATKPLVAAVLLGTLEAAGASPEQRVGDFVHHYGGVAELPIWRVLNHSAGLGSPNGVEAGLAPFDVAVAAARSARPASTAAYSDFVSAVVVADVIGALAGRPTTHVLAHAVDGWGLGSMVRFHFEEADIEERFDRLGYFVWGLPDRAVPSFYDAVPALMSLRRDVFGGYSSAAGLCEFYRLVGVVLTGGYVPNFPSASYFRSALSRRRGRKVDAVLRRPCDFAAGFMIDLADHGFGELGAGSVGHSGVLGSPFGFYDPRTGVAAGCIVNGVSRTNADVDYLRRRIVSAIVATGEAVALA